MSVVAVPREEATDHEARYGRAWAADSVPATAVRAEPEPRPSRAGNRLFIASRLAVPLVPVVLVLLGFHRDVAVSPVAGPLVAICLVAIWFAALEASYRASRLSPLVLGAPWASAIGAAAGLAAAFVVGSWLPVKEFAPVELLAIAGGVFVLSVAVETLVFRRRPRRVLVVGATKGGAELVHDLEGNTTLPFDCLGLVAVGRDGMSSNGNGAGNGFVGRIGDLQEIVALQRPDVIVLAGVEHEEEALHALVGAGGLAVRVVPIDEFYEHAFGYVPLSHVTPAWFLGIIHLYRRPYSRITKRLFDLSIVAIIFVLTAPLWPVIALLVWSTSRGPILFRQVRLGEGGKPFAILKFRTMVDGAEEPGKPIWATKSDQRVTLIGRFLRRTRLDELPQLWNVLRGDMSVVGPRPERPEFLQLLEQGVPFWTRRNLVRPGITGWAQLRNGYTSDLNGASRKLSYDLYYLKHHSLMLDLAITVRTASAVVSGIAEG